MFVLQFVCCVEESKIFHPTWSHVRKEADDAPQKKNLQLAANAER